VPPQARARFLDYFRSVREVLVRGRAERGRVRGYAAAAIGHAIGFHTWRSLVREQKLENEEAVELMTLMVNGAGLAPRG
jgi:hypothetical protein